ncbi:dimethylarginine dimethylaminohydrolase family protein [Noviherbaspirillum soli]|uniref:dimethylarginine dimethylaminohydrolase family protein n=1 Tax=Noviherbaspirillum soli TaxID=1064518 RepID=UPI00188CE94A|nr:arginine deiminase-related protein [Noviherbaspirillum soli]
MKARFLMCAPQHFEVAYVINPWMEGNIARGSNPAAMQQWSALLALLRHHAQVDCISAREGVPDLVFTANAGLVLESRVLLSNFRHAERRPEEAYFSQWFVEHGFEVLALPPDVYFEGAGDALFDRRLPLLWMGHGHRSDPAAAAMIASLFDVEVEPLRLVNPHFYHLDTCLCPLEGGALLYYPAAFDAVSQERIATLVPPELRIAVGAADADAFACNAVNCGRHVILNQASDNLCAALAAHGYAVHQTRLSEFMKAGGSAKCLTLKLTEARTPALALP